MVRFALLMGALTAVAGTARADAPCAGPGPACGAPCYRTVTYTKCVPVTYTKQVTRYKTVCQKVPYTAYRCKSVCVPVEKVCCVTKRVPVYKTITRKVCKTVWHNECKTVMKPHYEWRCTTKMVKKCVQRGHWECRCVCKKPGLLERLCNPCACPRMVQRKVWVRCPVYKHCPVTCRERVCVMKPCTVNVRCCKKVWECVPCKICTYKCVTCKVKKTVHVRKMVKEPYTCCRIVRKCVPYTCNVTCTKMVQKCFTRKVPVCQPVCQPCCEPCCETTCCNTGCGGKGFGLFRGRRCGGGLFSGGLFGGLFNKGGCCEPCCETSCCDAGCGIGGCAGGSCH